MTTRFGVMQHALLAC
jgi:hypothetical protein